MSIFVRFALLLLALASSALPTAALAQRSMQIETSLAFETSSPQPGSTIRVALVMNAKPGWHAYWTNPGDAGAPPRIDWKAPSGFSFGELSHPAPSFFDVQGVASFVHEGSFALLTTMKVPSSLTVGEPLPITAKVSWLACSSSQCLPESRTIETVLVIGDGQTDYPALARIRRAESQIPSSLAGSTFTEDNGKLVFTIPSAGMSSGHLFPSRSGWFAFNAPQKMERRGNALVISIPALKSHPKGSFSGVFSGSTNDLKISAKWKEPVVAAETKTDVADVTKVDVASGDADADVVPLAQKTSANAAATMAPYASPEPGENLQANKPSAVHGANASGAWLLITSLLGALLGGLILNLMPCVFPILSLKALSLAKSSMDPATARVEGVGYTIGTTLTMLALGAMVLIARQMGIAAGWSFQLQSPVFVLGLLILVTMIVLNLIGVFEIGMISMRQGAASTGWRSSIGTGAMAALIASPCAGPFMAGALGAALVLPPIAALAIFAGLGLGMALPFLLVAFVPAIRNKIPKPGAWMNTLRRILAIPMIITGVWLAWVLKNQSGGQGYLVAMLIIASVGTLLWWLGKRQRKGLSSMRMVSAGALSVVVMMAGFFMVANANRVAQSAIAQTLSGGKVVFSQDRLDQLTSAGTPVFLDFTADWCLSCKVNDKVAIGRDDVQAALKEAGVVSMVGDWTNGDPAITSFLEKHGRNSIPFYAFYDGRGGMRIMPQVLSPSLLIKEAKRISDDR